MFAIQATGLLVIKLELQMNPRQSRQYWLFLLGPFTGLNAHKIIFLAFQSFEIDEPAVKYQN